uniref:Putative peptidase n=1 Tax=viral metagenome TaxID=1070528 RepID=A0A6M3L9M3_9ZZZZ
MPAPPRKGEKKADWISKCIAQLRNEGKDQDQAVAQCNSMYDQHMKKRRKNAEGCMKLMMDIIANRFWAMSKAECDSLLSTLHSKTTLDILAAFDDFEAFFFLFDDPEKEKEKVYKIEEGTAIFTIEGPLMKKAKGFFARLLGIQSVDDLRAGFIEAMGDPEVKTIFNQFSSPGGQVDGILDYAETVFKYRGTKPVMAFTDDHMASAAYWMAAPADYIVAGNETTTVGSIGVIANPHFDVTEALKRDGIKPYVFKAGKYKAVPSRFVPLSQDDINYIQGLLDHMYTAMVDSIAKYRGVSVESVLNMADGKIFVGSTALDVGLVDEIMTKEDALKKLRSS